MTDRPKCANCGAERLAGSRRNLCHRCLLLAAPRPVRYSSSRSPSGLGEIRGRLRRVLYHGTWSLTILGAFAGLAVLSFQDVGTARDRDVTGRTASFTGKAESGNDIADEPQSEAVAKLLGGGRTLKEPGPAEIRAVGFADGGRRAVALLADGALESWNVSDEAAGHTLAISSASILGAAGSKDWSRIVAVHADNRLRAWDGATGAEIFSRLLTCFRAGKYPNSFLAVTDDGSTAAYIDTSEGVGIVNLADSTERTSSRAPSGASAAAFALSGDGKLLVVGYSCRDSRANLVEVWETAAGRMAQRMEGHHGSVLAVALSPDGHQVLSTGKDATLCVWEIATGREVSRYGLLPGAGNHIAVSPRGRLVLVGTGHRWSGDQWTFADSYGVQVWDLDDGRLLGQFETDGLVCAMAVSSDGQYALAAGEDGSVSLWPMPGEPPVHDDAGAGSVD